jgi:hypothetical protein
VNESIDSCEDGINDLKKKLKKIEGFSLDDGWGGKAKSQFRRTLYPFKESTLAKLEEITSELQDQLGLAINVLQMLVIRFSYLWDHVEFILMRVMKQLLADDIPFSDGICRVSPKLR